ncbi:adenylyl-sulfate kinase [Desulfocurvus sp.]|jgi:adenylylsulfate kinase|uniref:adenylyl-sulfate kinase n=1 Tax=Desulfocurvus sp. TaxID=2871698 RepID=UPI0025BB5A36|nr:adenylyl-sulfate kinase [Desulfocurvus sp.]
MSFTLWFTGLSGAGKTTLSRCVYLELRRRGLAAELLDGDIIRTNFSSELGFSRRDRDVNVRRIGFVSHLLNRHGVVSVVAAIAPYALARAQNRELLENYVEVFVNCPLEVTERRDVKGLYARARAGQISNFTGVSDPYEEPRTPEVTCFTDREDVATSVGRVLEYLQDKGLAPPAADCQPGEDCERADRQWRSRLARLGYARAD